MHKPFMTITTPNHKVYSNVRGSLGLVKHGQFFKVSNEVI